MIRKVAFRKSPEIRAERLTLRKPSVKDVEWCFEYFSRLEIVWGGGDRQSQT